MHSILEKTSDILWKNCTQILRDNVTPSVYNTWFAPLELVKFENDVLILRVKSQFVVDYIEENYIDLLSKAIWRVFGQQTQLEYHVLMDSTTGQTTTYKGDGMALRVDGLSQPIMEASFSDGWDTQLNENYTFANFVQGETNKLARTAGVAIAKDPGKTVFNPLFIYGGSGVGKTHLANAIGNQVARQMNGTKVLYVNANTFKLQYQNACQQNKIPDFLMFYRNVDVLIIDDIQYFSGLNGTQDTFFHIFNYLHQSRKQLILTSDRSPLELKDVEERLLTRFKWGLDVEIRRPDYDLRKAILEDKIKRYGLELNEDIVDYIAAHTCDNVRDIEGILASLMAYATLMNSDVDMSLVRQVVDKLVKVQHKQVQMEDVLRTVAEHEGVSEKLILSQSRQREAVRARQMVAYLTKQLTDTSYYEIGRTLGHRSHATIMHAINSLQEQVTYDPVLNHALHVMENELVH